MKLTEKNWIVLTPTCGIEIGELVDKFIRFGRYGLDVNTQATIIGNKIRFYRYSLILEPFLKFMIERKYTFELSLDSI